MPLQYLFWAVYILSVFFAFWANYDGPAWPRRFGAFFVAWALIGMLGYRVFGAAIK